MGLKPKKYEDKTYGISTYLDFGKYRGCTVGNILEKDPQYILWAMDKIDGFKLTGQATQALEDKMEEAKDFVSAHSSSFSFIRESDFWPDDYMK